VDWVVTEVVQVGVEDIGGGEKVAFQTPHPPNEG
jgi:hypothetical protein